MATIQELKEIRKDYIKRYFEILGVNGICKKSNEYQSKIERIEAMIINLGGTI